MAKIAIQGLSKRFGDAVAVEDMSIDVADGEFVALVGPSGCGKTTTLRIVAGLERADSGAVLVDDMDITDCPAKDRNLAMVFQSYALYPHLSVAENIGFALKLRGMARAEIAQRVRAAAERLEIGALLDRRPRALSGGQRQRVAVARAIVREPHAFLFDEPLSNLDARLRASARVEISGLQRALGVTTLYVTHDQVEAMAMADRIVLMCDGRIRQVGAPLTLYDDPEDAFVAGFLGAPPMNLLSGVVRRGAGGPRFALRPLETPAPASMPEGGALLGVRPEALALGEIAGAALSFRGVVRHVERLGAETIALVDTEAGAAVTARAPGIAPFRAGEPVSLSALGEALYFFDADGVRVRQSAPTAQLALARA